MRLLELQDVGYQGCCPEPAFAVSSCGAQSGSNYFLPAEAMFKISVNALITIDHLIAEHHSNMYSMKAEREKVLAVRCPTCGARPGEKCELGTGQPRTEPHRDRRLAASDK